MTSSVVSAHPAHLGWRLLALLYDLFPVFAMSLLFGALVTGIAAALGHPDVSGQAWAPWVMTLGLWGFSGAYFVVSWSRGGATLGMRPWRLRVLGADGRPASTTALLRRYAAATLPALLVLELAALLALGGAEDTVLDRRRRGRRGHRLVARRSRRRGGLRPAGGHALRPPPQRRLKPATPSSTSSSTGRA